MEDCADPEKVGVFFVENGHPTTRSLNSKLVQDLGEKILLSIFFQYLHLSFLEDRKKFANNSIVSNQGGKKELFCILEKFLNVELF